MSNSNDRVSINPIPIRSDMKVKTVDEKGVERIHQATLTILKEIGVRFPFEKALNLFAEAGADVDFKTQLVKIPSDLLMDSLSRAPRAFTMASRGSPALDLYLDGTKTYIGTSGTGASTVDFETRKRRASTKKDVATMALLSDYLSCISFYWPSVSAQDAPSQVVPLHELEASFTNTEKHVHIISCVEEKIADYAVEMAIVIAGGAEAVRKRPPLSLLVCAISPLTQDKGSLEAALTFAEAGLPVGFGTMPIVGSTAPASVAGTMVVGNAEILSALCLIQLASPGAPVWYPFFSGMINPYTGGCLVSTPQKILLSSGAVELAHYYNLPAMVSFGGTDANEPGIWQTGKEKAAGAHLVCLAGPELVPALGLLEAFTLLYLEEALFDREIFDSVRAVTEGIHVDSEALAIDEIMAVGPGGHFLDRDYTCERIRELWRPGIAHQWSTHRGDFRDPREAAVEKIKWVLNNHKPALLGERVKKELERIIKAAEKELVA